MDDKKLVYPDHRYISRRDFLGCGAIASVGLASIPLLGSLLKAQVLGKPLASSAPSVNPFPFFVFDMAGGAALPGNFLVGKDEQLSELLPSYAFLGWNPHESGALDSQFGLPMSLLYSGIYQGIVAQTSPETRAGLRIGSVCHFGVDDTGTNPLNAADLIMQVGGEGQFINGYGTIRSLSGGRSLSALRRSEYSPVAVNSVAQIVGSLSLSPSLTEMSGMETSHHFAEVVHSLGLNQVKNLPDNADGHLLKQLATKAFETAQQVGDIGQSLDARVHEDARQVFGIDENTAIDDPRAVVASLMQAGLSKISGPCVWTLGGCDYHDSTSETGDRKDREMGDMIGRCVELAARRGSPFMFQLITDGGCASGNGVRNWTTDAGDKSMTIIGFYHPSTPSQRRLQIGRYTNGQGADRSTLVGADGRMAPFVTLANYLNVLGRLDEFHHYHPSVFTGANELASVILFDEVG